MKNSVYVLTFTTLLCCLPARAALITDTVTVDGTEWAQAADFTGLSWTDIFNICGSGNCSGTLTSDSGTWDMDGWVWADVDAVNGLFNSYLEDAGVAAVDLLVGADSYSEADGTWAPAFLSDFESSFVNPDLRFVTGLTMSLDGAGRAYQGELAEALTTNAIPSDFTATHSTVPIGAVSSVMGAWFYRGESSGVPVPGSFALFSLGLAGLGWSRRKKA